MATKKPVTRAATLDDLLHAGYSYQDVQEPTAPEAPKEPTRNMFARVNDSVIDIGNSAANLVKSGIDLVSPDSSASAAIGDFIKGGEEKQSDWKKMQRRKLQEELAATPGQMDKVGVYLKHAVTEDPLGTASEAIGNLGPFAAAGKGMQAMRLVNGARTAATAGLSGGLSAGEVRGNIWERINSTPDVDLQKASPEYAALRAGGMPEADAKREIGASFARNAPEVLASGAVGALGGKFGPEAMAAKVAPQAAAKRIPATLIGMAQEGAEGASEQLATNAALKRVIPSQDLGENVALNAAQEGLVGAVGGAALGGHGAHTPAQPAVVPEVGPLSRAANSAPPVQATQVEASDGSVPAAAPVAGGNAVVPAEAAQPDAESVPIFNTQVHDIKAALSDPDTMQAVRERFGDQGTTEILSSLVQAQNPKVSDSLRKKHLQAVEEALFAARARREAAPPMAIKASDTQELPSPAAVPQLTVDTQPTGVMRVDSAGNAAPETRADAISTAQQVQERDTLGQPARRASAVHADEAPRAPLAITHDTTPTGVMLAGKEVRPETRAEVINREQAAAGQKQEQERKAALGLTPDVEQATAVRFKDTGLASGGPLKNRTAAQRLQRSIGGEVVPVDGGFVVRQQVEATADGTGRPGGPAQPGRPDAVGAADRRAGGGNADLVPSQQPGTGAAGSAAQPAAVARPGADAVVHPAGRGAPLTERRKATAAPQVSRETPQASLPLEAPVTPVDVAAHEAATSPHNDLPQPTQAQKEAGNYKVGRLNLHGMDISIENPRGSTRSGVDKGGKPWSVQMAHHYGYIRGTIGRDKDHVDVFVGPKPDVKKAFVIDQVHPHDGTFDEHKVVLGATSLSQARKVYLSNYKKGWKGLKSITEVPMEDFKKWVFDGPKNKPFAQAKPEAARSGPRKLAKVGAAPGSATEVELRANPDGSLTPWAEGHEMLDYDSGEPIKLHAKVSNEEAIQAIRKAGAISSKSKTFAIASRPTEAPAPAPATDETVRAETIRKAVNDIAAKWKNGPKGGVVVVDTHEDLPRDLFNSVQSANDDGARAYFDPKTETVYLIADRLPTMSEAQFALFHEAYGHYGMRSILGDDYGRMMMQLRLANQHVAAAASMWFAHYGQQEIADRVARGMDRMQAEREVRLLSTEEALADRAGLNEPLKGWHRLVAALQAGLRRIGLNSVADWLEHHTEAETLTFLARARAAVEGDGFADTKPAVHAPEGPVASRPSNPDWIANGSPELQAAAQKIHTYAPGKSLKDKIKAMTTGWQGKFVQGALDAYAPLKKLDMDAYIAARMTKAADGAFEGMLLYGKPVMNDDGSLSGNLDHKGFLGIMKKLGGEHDRFFMWLAGQRAQRLKGEGRENLFNDEQIKAMVALNQGTMKDGRSRADAYRGALTEFRSYNKSVMDIAEKAGLIDGESRASWEHDIYVPFFRMSQEDSELSAPGRVKGLVRQKAFDKLKGGTENLGDLMDNALRNWSHLLSASMANVAARKSLLAAEKVSVAIEAKEDTAREMAKSIGKKGGAVYFMDHGQQRWFVVEDPAVLAAITSMEAVGANALPLKLMSKFKHFLTLGTTISPAFKLRNLIRDTIAAPATNEMSYKVWENVAHGWTATAKGSDAHAQMLFGGALMRFGTYLEGDRAENVKRLIAAGVKDETILDTREKVEAALKKAWDAWQNFGDRLENVNRAALYEQLIKEGKSPREAAFLARDMLDFSLQGSNAAMRMLTQVVPFLNARAQGLYKLGRAAKQDPKRFGYVAGAVALASIALMLANKDDEDWKAREDWDRDGFWWIKIGDTAFRIPKPFEIGAIGTVAERSVEAMVSDEMTGSRFAQRLKAMLLDTFAFNPTPQLVKPLIDVYANKDSFTGREIESQGLEKHSKAERATPQTSTVGRVVGSAGNVTNISPVQVDFLIHAYFGWLGSVVSEAVDTATSPLQQNQRPAKRWDDWASGFAKQLPTNQSRYVTEFFDQLKQVNQVAADIKAAREAGDQEHAQQLAEDGADKIAVKGLYQQAELRMRKIAAQMRQVRADATMDAETKRARLDALAAQRNALAERVRTQATRQTQ